MRALENCRQILAALLGAHLMYCAVVSTAYAESQSPESTNYTSLFEVDGGAAAYEASGKTVEIFARNKNALDKKAQFKVAGQVGALAQTPLGIAVATGQGRGDLAAPIRVTLYDATGANPRAVFEQAGERSQLSFLKWVDGKLWATFFESKYITKTGFFLPSKTLPWAFNEVKSVRLGDAVDVLGDSVIIGRPYGDAPGQDGDVSLLKGDEQMVLPSYRGVRSVLAFNGPSSQEIVIGDGWHQNYGQNAQARLSWLKKDSESGKYALQIIEHDTSQYNFSKLRSVVLSQSTFIAALGNKQLMMYGPRPTWKKSVLYTRTIEENYFDFVSLDSDSKGAWFLVLDKGLHLVRFENGKITTTAASLQ